MDVSPFCFYIHKDSGREVQVTVRGRMLIGTDWIDSVTYYTMDNNEYFTRPLEQFKEKFFEAA